MANPKLREVRLELQARLGFGAVDNPAIAPILNSFINEAQEQLYAVGWFKNLDHVWSVTALTGSAVISIPTDAFGALNSDRIEEVSANFGSVGSPAYREVKEGVSQNLRAQVVASFPARYERQSGGIAIFPPRDVDYPVQIKGMRALVPLRDDGDELSIDKPLVFALALAAGKSHYRHPDAQLYLTKANGHLNAVKWQQSGPRIIKPKGCDDDAEPRPVVV
jgi:hypothetical protein